MKTYGHPRHVKPASSRSRSWRLCFCETSLASVDIPISRASCDAHTAIVSAVRRFDVKTSKTFSSWIVSKQALHSWCVFQFRTACVFQSKCAKGMICFFYSGARPTRPSANEYYYLAPRPTSPKPMFWLEGSCRVNKVLVATTRVLCRDNKGALLRHFCFVTTCCATQSV